MSGAGDGSEAVPAHSAMSGPSSAPADAAARRRGRRRPRALCAPRCRRLALPPAQSGGAAGRRRNANARSHGCCVGTAGMTASTPAGALEVGCGSGANLLALLAPRLRARAADRHRAARRAPRRGAARGCPPRRGSSSATRPPSTCRPRARTWCCSPPSSRRCSTTPCSAGWPRRCGAGRSPAAPCSGTTSCSTIRANPDVRGVPLARVRELFPAGRVESRRAHARAAAGARRLPAASRPLHCLRPAADAAHAHAVLDREGAFRPMTDESTTPRPFLPFALPDIGEDEIAEVVDTLRSGWVTTGPKAKRFEEAFAAWLAAPPLPRSTPAPRAAGRRRQLGHRRAAPGARGARHRPGRRGDRADAHLHRHRRGGALPRRRREAGRHRRRHAQHRPRRGGGGAHAGDAGDRAGAFRRAGGRHEGAARHRLAARPEGRRGCGACAADHLQRRDRRHAGAVGRHRVQLLRHQDHHHRRGRHARHARRRRSPRARARCGCTA